MIIGYIERNLDYLHLSPIGSSAFRNMFRGESELRKPFTGRGEQIVVVCEKSIYCLSSFYYHCPGLHSLLTNNQQSCFHTKTLPALTD